MLSYLNCVFTGFSSRSLKRALRDFDSFEIAECKYGPIGTWDVSAVTDMSDLFKYISLFNHDISGWDVSKVTNMSGMFKKSKFNRDISNWDVSNVKDMSYMFFDSKFNQDISQWNV